MSQAPVSLSDATRRLAESAQALRDETVNGPSLGQRLVELDDRFLAWATEGDDPVLGAILPSRSQAGTRGVAVVEAAVITTIGLVGAAVARSLG